jgi:alpha-1,2-mannosyltransferase
MTTGPNDGENRFVPYVLGNGGALFVGLLSCYGVLAVQGNFEVRGLDVFFYYCVSHLVVVGHGADIYNLHALGQIEATLAHGFSVPSGVVPNAYPPSFVLLLAPLAFVPYTAAYFIWLGVNCLLLGLAFFALERIANLHGRASFLFRVLTALSLPVLLALIHGQASILMLACLALALLAFETHRDLLAGVALAGLLTKPQYLPALVIALLVLQRWRAIFAFAVASVCELLVPVPILGSSSIGSWLNVLVTARNWSNRPGFASPSANRGVSGQVNLLLHGLEAEAVTVTVGVLVVLALIWVVARSQRVDLAIGLATVVGVLMSPHVLIHDLSLLAVPVAVALRHRNAQRRSLTVVLSVGYLLVLVGFAVAIFAPVQLTVPAMLGLGVWLVVLARPWARATREGTTLSDTYLSIPPPMHARSNARDRKPAD